MDMATSLHEREFRPKTDTEKLQKVARQGAAMMALVAGYVAPVEADSAADPPAEAAPAAIPGVTLNAAHRVATNVIRAVKNCDGAVLVEALNDVYRTKMVRVGGLVGGNYANRISDFYSFGSFQEQPELKTERRLTFDVV
ncbi:unnamed protein product [Amoebophrya sp. A25]|nr:unnamed protein product [Amoebophrya sp. A25]|eukprot:GSA25T00020374001.1